MLQQHMRSSSSSAARQPTRKGLLDHDDTGTGKSYHWGVPNDSRNRTRHIESSAERLVHSRERNR